MNEEVDEIDWGLPDWTALGGYPPKSASVTTWAWEFLRRWKSYREFWCEKIEPFLKDGSDGISRIGCAWPHYDELRARFGVDVPSRRWDQTPAYFTANWVTWSEGPNVSLGENEIAIIIDLKRPLKRQFLAALKSAEREQKYRRIAPKPARARGSICNVP